MKRAFTLALVLILHWAMPLGAADTLPPDALAAQGPRVIGPGLTECPAPTQADRFAQVNQSDCCKGHKGVCGCRAGKIVCCDNTASASCTCHAESGVEN